jgi:phospholipase/lecithinase/hemolysin
MHSRPLLLALASVLTLSAGAHAGTLYSSIFVFGDSLSDTGNVYAATGNTFPASPPYFNGRFSNGPLWVERLAQDLSLPRLDPGLVGPTTGTPTGTNFALGGQKIDTDANFGLAGTVPSFLKVSLALVNNHVTIPSDALVTLWIGANDLSDPTLSVTPSSLVDSLFTGVAALNSIGAKHFLILDLPPLGIAPEVAALGPAASAIVNNNVAAFDLALATKIATGLPSDPSADLHLFSTAALYAQLAQNPAAFGFTNLTDPAFNGTTVVPNPNQYLSWDGFHPTARVHQLLGDAIAASIPEPTATIFPLVVATTTLRRQRRA